MQDSNVKIVSALLEMMLTTHKHVSGPEVIKLFSSSTQLSMKFILFIIRVLNKETIFIFFSILVFMSH